MVTDTPDDLLCLHQHEALPPQEPATGAWLGGACFGAGGQRDNDPDMPQARVRLSPLTNDGLATRRHHEAWAVQGTVQQSAHDGLVWRSNASWWFGVVQIDENAFRDSVRAGTPLQQAVRHAYTLLFDTLQERGNNWNLVRIWNHIAGINDETDGLERYRQFNIARQDVFLSHDCRVTGSRVPAASALGTSSDAPLVIYALATRKPVQAVENPRQVSAYCYPDDYGPRSPTFSRAVLAMQETSRPLFISGTASIVGHRSLHANDVVEQTRETLRNIKVLLEQASSQIGELSLRDLTYKVYVRHAADWPKVYAELRDAVGARPRALALRADICRTDLLVEIEAVGFGPGGRAS